MLPAAALILLSLGSSAAAPPAAPSVIEVESAALKGRKSIRRGVVSLEARFTTQNGARDGHRSHTLWFDFDKDRFRADVINTSSERAGQNVPGAPPPRHIQGLNCQRPNYYVDYWDVRRQPDSSTTIELKPMTTKRREHATEIFDPRLLGLAPARYTALHNYQLEKLLERTDRDAPELKEGRWKEQDCLIISYHNLRNVRLELWVAPKQGHSVVRSLAEATVAGKVRREVVEAEYGPVGAPAVWFPRSWVYELFVDGKSQAKEVGRVTQASLNEPVDDRAFTLAGMNIAPGTVIDGESPDGRGVTWDWTGDDVVDHVSPEFVPTVHASSNADRRVWLTVAAVACALATTLFTALYWRRGRGKPA